MNKTMNGREGTASTVPPVRGVLQRKCACGNHRLAGTRCAGCEQKAESRLQRLALADGTGSAPPIVHEVLNSTGQALDSRARGFLEPRFGHDFSHVRVHTGSVAAASAEAVNALAYTVGRDVVLGDPHESLSTAQGMQLIAHELAHVVQQGNGSFSLRPLALDRSPAAEQEADRVAAHVASGYVAEPISSRVGPSLHRKVKVDKPKDSIPNPTRKGLKQTNAQTVEGYLQTLCSGGSLAVDSATGVVSMAAGFCPIALKPGEYGPQAPAPADKSKEPTGCGCLCDMVDSANDFTIVVDDKDWPHTMSRVVTTPSPNSPKLWGAATVSGKTTIIDPWLVLGHELCGHAWLAEKGLPDDNATRGEGGHQETVSRENELRKEHGIEARGGFKDPYCGESFWKVKKGPVQWSRYLKDCAAWRKRTYGSKYKISDKIP